MKRDVLQRTKDARHHTKNTIATCSDSV